MSRIVADEFRVPPGRTVHLGAWPTQVSPLVTSKQEYLTVLERHVAELSALQQLLFASDRHALLVILQGMDSAGKDGVIRHVMSGVNPQGCEVRSFKAPGPLEMRHDFLWRAAVNSPERGRIGIFNRSYYEDVLIVRVHPQLLRGGEGDRAVRATPKFWRRRYQSILDWERHQLVNGTCIVKIFLHLSKDEQRKRLIARIDVPEKNWKITDADVTERRFWRHYMRAYERCLEATSTAEAPWYVVPADDKDSARLIVSRIVLDALRSLKMHYPRVDAKRRRELLVIRRRLER